MSEAEAAVSNDKSLLTMAADIVAAYVIRNALPQSELPTLLLAVHAGLQKIETGAAEIPVVEQRKEPAVAIKKSVTPDFIICLEDGKKFKSLKRHLTTAYRMSPDQYRAKWGLARDYPMVAPHYAKVRSELARQAGLGQRVTQTAAAKKKPAKKAA